MSQTVNSIIAAVFVLLVGISASHGQDAAVPERAMFLIVDYERVGSEAAALMALSKELEEARTRQAAAHNLTLDKLEENFAPYRLNRADIPPEDYAEALKVFNDATAEMEATLAEVEAELNAAAEAGLAAFDAVRLDVEAELKAEYRVSRLVDAVAALYVKSGSVYDVTDELIRRIDKRLPILELPEPS